MLAMQFLQCNAGNAILARQFWQGNARNAMLAMQCWQCSDRNAMVTVKCCNAMLLRNSAIQNQCSSVMQSKAAMQWYATQCCDAMLQCKAAMQCCNVMHQCNAAMQFCEYVLRRMVGRIQAVENRKQQSWTRAPPRGESTRRNLLRIAPRQKDPKHLLRIAPRQKDPKQFGAE